MFFSSLHRKLYTIFQPPFFPIERCQDILIKLLTLSTDSVTNFLASKIGPEFGNKLYGQICDRVSTQSKKLKYAILVAFDRGKCGLENGV